MSKRFFLLAALLCVLASHASADIGFVGDGGGSGSGTVSGGTANCVAYFTSATAVTCDTATGPYLNPTLDRLGLLTTTPLATLDVAGSARITATTTSVLTGSINPTASTAVVGVGTLFTTELIVGDTITVSGESRLVTAITDNTNLTVSVAFTDVANDTSPDKYPASLVIRESDGTAAVAFENLNGTGCPCPSLVFMQAAAGGPSYGPTVGGISYRAPTEAMTANFFLFRGGQYLFENESAVWMMSITPTGVNVGSLAHASAVPVSKFEVSGNASIGATYARTNAAPANGLLVEGKLGVGTVTTTPAQLNADGAAAVAGYFVSTGGEVTKTKRNVSVTSLNFATASIQGTTSGDMVDGFGPGLYFKIEDTAAVENTIAMIGAVRNGADNSGALTFLTSNAGSQTEKWRINLTGDLLASTDNTPDIGANAATRPNDIYLAGRLAVNNRATVTVDGATTFAVTSSYTVLACTGAETINTITGGVTGMRLVIENTDTDCTIADDDDATAANAVDLTGTATTDVGAVAKVIELIYNGSSWLQLGESDN